MFDASPFKLNMFLNCSRQYKFHYVDGLAKKYFKPKPYLTMGENVHAALKEFFMAHPNQRSLDRLENFLRSKWKRNRAGFSSVEEERSWGEQALLMVKNFYEKFDTGAVPLFTEDFIKTAFDETLTLIGRIDRVDLRPDGSLEILDYKTGRPPKDPEAHLRTDIQLAAYSMIAAREFGRRVTRASYLFLSKGQALTVDVSDEYLGEKLDRIKEIVELILDELEFSPRPGPLCPFCDFMAICPLGGQPMGTPSEPPCEAGP